ncbi:S8 family serine peptidase [Candidatus Dojkabacteria bacterium]|nr:S8 family serine peptidase [Candidatus Dojkabacteria bacterium]
MSTKSESMQKFIKFFKDKKVIITLISSVIFLCCILSSCVLFSSGSSNAELGEAYYQEPDLDNVIQTEEYGEVIADEILVVLKEDASKRDANKLAKSIGGKVVGEVEFINLFQIKTSVKSEEQLNSLISEIQKYDYVEIVGPESFLFLKEIQGTACTLYEDMYTVGENSKVYQMVRLEEAWRYIKASGVKLNKVHVGVTDSGLNTTSEELDGNVKISALSKDDENNVPDVNKKGKWDTGGYNHGTAVTNMIGADWSNGGTIGVAGGLGENLEITVSNLETGGREYTAIPVSNVDEEDLTEVAYYGRGYMVKTFSKMVKQIENGATIINYSWGSEKPDLYNSFDNAVFRKFLNKVAQKYPKVLFVAAAGNEADKGVALNGTNYDLGGTPAPNVITVGSVDNQGNRSWFSNKVTGGGEISLVAVGSNVPAVIHKKTGEAVNINGTSFATPQVTATAAMLRSINPDLTAAEIKDILVSTAVTEVKMGGKEKTIDSEAGGPLLQIHKAVLKVINDTRKAQKLPELKEEDLRKMGTIKAYAQQDEENPLEYKIIAELEKVSKGGTDVKVEMSGNGAFFGSSSKTLRTPGKLNWGFGFTSPDDQATLTLTRMDTNACSKIPISAIPFYQGKFEGHMYYQIDQVESQFSTFYGNDDFYVDLKAEVKEDKSVDIKMSSDTSYNTTLEGFPVTASIKISGNMAGTYNEEENIITASGNYNADAFVQKPKEIGGNDSISFKDLEGFSLNGSHTGDKFEGTCIMIDHGYTLNGTFVLERVGY